MEEEYAIGLDLGTTFSCIAVYRNSAVEIIPNEKGDRTTPSIVSFLDDEIYPGELSEYKTLKDPKNKIYAVKRIIGRNYDDKEVQEGINNFSYNIENDNGCPKIVVDSNGIKKYSPEEIAAKILSKLKKSAEDFLQQKIKIFSVLLLSVNSVLVLYDIWFTLWKSGKEIVLPNI